MLTHQESARTWAEIDIMEKTCVRIAMKIIIPDLDLKSPTLQLFFSSAAILHSCDEAKFRGGFIFFFYKKKADF